jgi:hypothetical protein
LPHNDELKGWLSYLARSFDVPGGKLSASGQALMRDLSKLVGLLRSVVDEKNRDELLQRFFYHAKLAARLALQGLSRTGKIQIVKEPRRQVFLFGSRDEVVAERARKMRKEALREVRALYRLVQFLLGSSEFREVVGQSQTLIKKIIASERGGVGRAQQRVQFKGGEGEGSAAKPATKGAPISSKSAAELDEKIRALRSDVKSTEAAFRQQAEIVGESGYVQLSGFVEVSERTTAEGEYLYQSKGVEGQRKGEEGGEEEEGPLKPQQRQSTRKREIRRIGEQPKEPEAFPEPTEKQTAENPIFKAGREGGETASSSEEEFYAVEEPEQVVPEQGQLYAVGEDEIVADMRRLFQRASANPEFQKTIRDALSYLRALQATTSGAIREPTGPIPGELQYEENIRAAQRDLLHILERFANGRSVDPLIQVGRRLQSSVARDYELKDFFGDWLAFIRRCLGDPAYLESEEYDRRATFLLERTRALSQSSQYRSDFDEANGALSDFLAGWQQDPLTRAIGDTLQRILRDDLRTGGPGTSRGNGLFLFNALNPDLIGDLRHTILPSLLASLHELPIPRIESLSDGTRLVLENIVIPAGGFVPVDLDVRSQARLRMSPRERLRGETRASSGWQNGLRIRMYM